MENDPATTTDPYTAPATDPVSADLAAVTVTAPEAPLGSRIGAYLIDIGVVIVISLVFSRISSALGSVLTIAYMLTRDSLPFLDGQSLGKKLLKIKAVTEDGKSLSGNWQPGLVRNAVLFIPFFPIVELIILITNQGKPIGLRRLGDQWAKTKVIRVD